MAPSTRAVCSQTLGAWLVKARPDGLPHAAIARSGFAAITSRCIRPSYRTDLIDEGQPVLLWVSGADPRHPRGIHAVGVTTGPARAEGTELAMPVLLRAVDPVLPHHEIARHPMLAAIEVLAMPAGSNPSYLDVAQYACLREAFPGSCLGEQTSAAHRPVPMWGTAGHRIGWRP